MKKWLKYLLVLCVLLFRTGFAMAQYVTIGTGTLSWITELSKLRESPIGAPFRFNLKDMELSYFAMLNCIHRYRTQFELGLN